MPSVLLDFCTTELQREVVNAVESSGGNVTAAAKQLKKPRTSVSSVYHRVLHDAQMRGELGDMKQKGHVPPGFYAETTVMRRLNEETGEMVVTLDHTKSRLDKEQRNIAWGEYIAGLTTDIIPVDPVPFIPTNTTSELANAFIFGDAHLGMLAHAIETNQSEHNLEIAVADLMSAVDYLLMCAPPSEEGWFINVGDFLHTADSTHLGQHGQLFDVSDRHNQIVRAAGQLQRHIINRMLSKFPKVTVVNARGNHDRDAAFALNLCLEVLYENEPRVTVLNNDSKFQYLEFGNTLLGINHGDKINLDRLAGVMTRTQAEAWGRTIYHRWLIGHIHHKMKFEHASGVTIESFHTLAPIDTWHADSGYGAEQKVTMLTFHREFGEVNATSPDIRLIRAFRKDSFTPFHL